LKKTYDYVTHERQRREAVRKMSFCAFPSEFLKRRDHKAFCFVGYRIDDRCDEIWLIIPDKTRAAMNERLILEDNVKSVIFAAEASGKRMYCEEEDVYTAYQEQGRVTFWARYRPADDGYLLLDAYLHRMRIVGGQSHGGEETTMLSL
jgi:hypothetical protein